MAIRSSSYDRMQALRAFDDTKAGVKALVDAGVATIPAFFVHNSQDPLHEVAVSSNGGDLIPVISLKNIDTDPARRIEVVRQLKEAASGVGFFQVVEHGVTEMEEMLQGVRRFHEEDVEVKKAYYSRDDQRKVRFFSNFDLFESPAANWLDTLYCSMAPQPPEPEEFPPAVRDVMLKYTKRVQDLGLQLFEMLSEALGLERQYLKNLAGMGTQILKAVGAHYYPACPEPHRTLGITSHSDPDFLTVLLQDGIGGLQILHGNRCIDLPSLPGALIVNIGNMIQLLSNDAFKSVEHRVVSKSIGPRVSVACFFDGDRSRIYGPIKELTSDPSNPPLYRNVTGEEFFVYCTKRGMDGLSRLDNFRL